MLYIILFFHLSVVFEKCPSTQRASWKGRWVFSFYLQGLTLVIPVLFYQSVASCSHYPGTRTHLIVQLWFWKKKTWALLELTKSKNFEGFKSIQPTKHFFWIGDLDSIWTSSNGVFSLFLKEGNLIGPYWNEAHQVQIKNKATCFKENLFLSTCLGSSSSGAAFM